MNTDSSLVIVDAGVDWLTATCKRGSSSETLQEYAQQLLEKMLGDGNQMKLWKGQGYHGRTCGGVSVGVRHDGCILRLSSTAAASHYRQSILLADNVSRIDVQFTAFDNSHLVDRAHLAYHQIDEAPRRGGRPPTASLRLNKAGGQTCYIGSRTSDVVRRLYDKGIEKKNAPAGHYWRFEEEYKGDLARSVSDLVSGEEITTDDIAHLVATGFSRYSIPVPPHRSDDDLPVSYKRRPDWLDRETDNNRSLRWLKQSVAPSVRRLLDSGRRAEVLRALGLDGEGDANLLSRDESQP